MAVGDVEPFWQPIAVHNKKTHDKERMVDAVEVGENLKTWVSANEAWIAELSEDWRFDRRDIGFALTEGNKIEGNKDMSYPGRVLVQV
jgi:hypothetical protein